MSKIAHISSSPLETMKGGVPTYVRRLVEWQRSVGLNSVEIVRASTLPAEVHSLALETVSTKPSLGRFQGVAFRRVIRRLNREGALVCVHYLPHILWSPSTLFNGNYLMYFHGPAALEARSEGGSALYCAVLRHLEGFIYRRCRAIICLSEAFKDILVSFYGVPAAQVTVIPGHLDRDVVTQPQRTRKPGTGLRFITVRRLRSRMGLEVLIDACAEAFNDAGLKGSSLTIVGDGPLRAELEERVRSLGLTSSVLLTGGIPNEDRDRLLTESDWFVLPTRELEGFGMVVLEAIASGLPVIASAVGGVPEILNKLGWQNFLVEAGSVSALANKVIEVAQLSDPVVIPVATVNNLFSLDHLVPKHEALYRAK